MYIPKIERETIITYNEAEDTASVYTMNKHLQRKLSQMAQECPDSVKHSRDFPDGGVEYIVPKKSIRVNKPLKLSDAHREILAENARKNFHPKQEV